jgi:hypothetical protein
MNARTATKTTRLRTVALYIVSMAFVNVVLMKHTAKAIAVLLVLNAERALVRI